MNFKILSINKKKPINYRIQKTNKEILYHYTSDSGIKGILKSQKLWISRSDALNDTSEIVHMREVISNVIDKLREERKEIINWKVDNKAILFNNIIDFLMFAQTKIEQVNSLSDSQIFVLSLTENDNSLPLFSMYTSLEGYNFGMSVEKFFGCSGEEIVFRYIDNKLVTAGKVNYSFEEQISILYDDIIHAYALAIEGLIKSKTVKITQEIYEATFNELMKLILSKINIYSLFFKNSSFSYEEEYRVLFFIDDQNKDLIKTRINNGREIPFIEIDFSLNKINRITCGPKYREDGLKIIGNMLREQNINSIRFIKSKIPLR